MKLRTVHILNTWLLPRILSLSSITCLILHFSGCFYSFLMPLFDGRGCNLLATGASQHRLALMKAWIEFMVPDSGSEQRINWPCPSKLDKMVEMKPKLPNLNCLSWQTSLLALPPSATPVSSPTILLTYTTWATGLLWDAWGLLDFLLQNLLFKGNFSNILICCFLTPLP